MLYGSEYWIPKGVVEQGDEETQPLLYQKEELTPVQLSFPEIVWADDELSFFNRVVDHVVELNDRGVRMIWKEQKSVSESKMLLICLEVTLFHPGGGLIRQIAFTRYLITFAKSDREEIMTLLSEYQTRFHKKEDLTVSTVSLPFPDGVYIDEVAEYYHLKGLACFLFQGRDVKGYQ